MANRVNVDIPAIAGMLTTTTSVALSALSAAVALAALFLLDWAIGLAFLLVTPLAIVLIRRFVVDSRDLYARYRQAQDGIAGRLVDAVAGARTICVSGTTRREVARVTAGLPELERAGRRLWAVQRTVVASATMLLPAVLVTVLLAAGLSLHAGQIGPGGLVAAGSYTVIALGILDVIDSLAALSQLRVSTRRVAELTVGLPVRYGSRERLGTRPPTVAMHQVTVRDGTRPILDRLDVTLPAGSKTALVGPSGSGKSTTAAVIGRLRDPDGGWVTLDGVPVTALTAAELRRVITYAFDRPARLGRTLRELVSLGSPRLDADVLAGAARMARADGFVARLPLGWDTPVRQAPLSGGEWQRLGLTRAVARSATVVILDDATSSLDSATQASVLAAVDDLAAGRTVLTVTHQASVAAWADQVVWLDAGRVRATGPHDQLWAHPEYRSIFLGGEL
jgi:ATP-binding cassette subfamily B protein